MRCVQVVSAAVLRRLFQRVFQTVGAGPASAPNAELFAAAGHHFTRALRQANARAWFAVEVLLHGEELWERAQLEWERALDHEFFRPLRIFLDCLCENSLFSTSAEARATARSAVRKGIRQNWFASGNLDIDELARNADDGDDDRESGAAWQPRVDAVAPQESPGIRAILQWAHRDGTPLVVLLVAGFFCRAVKADADLFGELAEVVADIDGDEALDEACAWTSLFLDHRTFLESLLRDLAIKGHDWPEAQGPLVVAADDRGSEHLERARAHAQRGEYECAVHECTTALQLNPNSAPAHVGRGEVYRLKGDYPQALENYNAALRVEPGNSQALLARGQVHWLARQHARAIDDFTAFLGKHADNAAGYYFRGKANIDHGDLEAALADLSEAARLDPAHPWVYHDRGDAHAALADYDRAVVDYSQALRLNPHSAISYLRRAESYAAQGDYPRAVADYSQVLRLEPLNSTAYLGRGAAYRQLSQPKEAADDFSRALEIDESNPQLYFQRGLLYQQAGDYERALEDLDAAIALNPADAESYMQRGRAHLAFGAQDQALADFTETVRLAPRHALALLQRGMLYSERGSQEDALGDFSATLRIDPDCAAAYACRSRILSSLGLLDDALADCDSALMRDCRSMDAYLVRGSVLAQQGEFARAVADFTEALQLQPDNAQAFFLRGLAYHREGKLSAALGDLSAVLRLDRRNARAFAHRAAVLQAAHQNERALCDLAHAMRLEPSYASAYCQQLGLVHAQRAEFELATAAYSLVLLLEPNNSGARRQRNRAWKEFVAQLRNRRVPHPDKQLGAMTLAAATQFQLPRAPTLLMPAAVPAPADDRAAAETTEFELSADTAEATAPQETAAAEPSPVNGTVAAHDAVAATTASADPGGANFALTQEHERIASEREQVLRIQMEEDRRQKIAEFQRRLEESKKQADERRKREMNRLKRRFNTDDEDRMPVWKKGMLAAAACLAVWFAASWIYDIYSSWQAQARFTLARICRDFEKDATQARKKYDGGAFELTGKAKLVKAGREWRLAIETPEVPQWSVHCKFDLSPANFKTLVADKVQPGQEVTVEGRCSYQPVEGKGVILMEECVLRKTG